MEFGVALELLRNVSDELLLTHQEATISTIRQVEYRIQRVTRFRNPTALEERYSAQDETTDGGTLVQSPRAPASGLKRKTINQRPESDTQQPSKRQFKSKEKCECTSRDLEVYTSSLKNLTWIWELIGRSPKEVIRSYRKLELPCVLLRDIQKAERISNPTKEDKIFRVAALRFLALRFSIFAQGFARRKKTKRDGLVPRFVREFFRTQDEGIVKRYSQYIRSGQKQLKAEEIFRHELSQRSTAYAETPYAGTGISIFSALPITLFKNLPVKEIHSVVTHFFLDASKIMLPLLRPSTNSEPPIEQAFSILEVMERVSKWLVEFQVCYDEDIKVTLCQGRASENFVSRESPTADMATPKTPVAGPNQHSGPMSPFSYSVSAANVVTPITENMESGHEVAATAIHGYEVDDSSSGQSFSDRILHVDSLGRNEWLHKRRKTHPTENTHLKSHITVSLPIDTFHTRYYSQSYMSLDESTAQGDSIMGLNREALLTEAAEPQDAFNPREFSQPYLSLDESTAQGDSIIGLNREALLTEAAEPQDAFNPREFSQPYLSLDESTAQGDSIIGLNREALLTEAAEPQDAFNPREFSQPYLSLDEPQSVFNPREYSQPYLSLDESTTQSASTMGLNSETLLTETAEPQDAFNLRQYRQPYTSLGSHTVQEFPRSRLPYTQLPEKTPAVGTPNSPDRRNTSIHDFTLHDVSYSTNLTNVGLRQMEVLS